MMIQNRQKIDPAHPIPDHLKMIPEDVLTKAKQTLYAARPALPRRENLTQHLADAEAANTRGYYLPIEDERLREVLLSYLGARAALWEMIDDLRPYLGQKDNRVFSLAFCAAALLVRSGNFLIDLARERPVVWKKLDEAEPRYGLKRKSFTQIYKNFASARWMWRYHEAWRYYDRNQEPIHRQLRDSGFTELSRWLREEEANFQKSRKTFLERRISYGIHSLIRRQASGYTKMMFHLFRISGSTIAELKQPFKKARHEGKRVSEEIRQEARLILKPGDVIVTRHDDAMSNLFLPGFWPHAALYLGSSQDRKHLDLPTDPGSCDVLEAKKDGVLFRELSETLSVDAFVIIRPNLPRHQLATALARATSHAGKLYDFIFDFRKSDRLVCTEVIYRTYQGIGPIEFELTPRSGRLALSAEDLLNQAMKKDLFEIVALFGVHGASLEQDEAALAHLRESLGHPKP